MAYAFDRIMNAMGRGEDETQQTNVFEPVNYSAMDGGEIGGGSGGGGSPSQGQQSLGSLQQAPTAGASRAIAANTGRVKSPVDVAGVTSRIRQAKSDAQDEADAYVTQATQPYQLNNGQLTDADKQDFKNYAYGQGDGPNRYDSTFNTRLSQYPTLAQPFTLQTPTNFAADMQQVDLVSSPAGLQQAFRMYGDPETSRGEAAFNATLLQRDPTFGQAANTAVQSAADLNRTVSDIAMNTTPDAQKAQKSAWEDWQKAAKSFAKTELDTLREVGAKTQEQMDTIPNEEGIMSTAQEAYNAFVQQNPSLAPFVKPPTINDVMPFLTASSSINIPNEDGILNELDFLTEDQASAFNRISEALGLGERTSGFTGYNTPPEFNPAAYSDWLKSQADSEIWRVQPKQSSRWQDIFASQPTLPPPPPTTYDVDMPDINTVSAGTTSVPVMPINPASAPNQPNAQNPIDYSWQGQAFEQIQKMLDPRTNWSI
jgi:hypothetical protein